jgi:hypothetical protein
MIETTTRLLFNDEQASVLPSDFDALGHVFIGRMYEDWEDILFMTVSGTTEDPIQFVALHPDSLSGVRYNHADLSTFHYRPVTDIVYNVKVAG